ncbi:predicted protein [Naegleria gruberi]|uniref:isoleucine--tRNA ligase n=1 Tax=Naegleria gruberi TaxID=5762 RepID=D2VBA5_NAEGR|nr:uncharacterized protein NAEGRDRAFT_66147 [Naegleria gruberi]EFC45761.1 predicted protein [Naegleria gruberi]|eukprot:XP_002678505.1 predicted protein [Naegleria gruberi strain NEG-M]
MQRVITSQSKKKLSSSQQFIWLSLSQQTSSSSSAVAANFSTSQNLLVDERDKRFSHTILLPKSNFKTKASLEEELTIQQISRDYAYTKLKEDRLKSGAKRFTLHDGPPYANGTLHTGHFLNKVLKDITNRFKLLTGHLVEFIPGWDCHGLPIESKVFQEIKKKKKGTEGITISGTKDPIIRKLAKDFAEQAIQSQLNDFKRWGVMGEWDNPYKTMNPTFEAQQLRIFLDMLNKKYIFRGKKPVYWSPSSGTALAESELEYPDVHISKSCYVLFPITTSNTEMSQKYGELFATVWTTTPWTLIANEAISYNQDIEYSIIYDSEKHRRLIIASELMKSVCEKTGIKNFTVLQAMKGKDLFVNNDILMGDKVSSYVNPLTSSVTDKKLPFLNGSHVTTEVGTGLVHTAPNHGIEDFQVVKDNSLPIGPCFVDEYGKYNSQTPLPHLIGLPVLSVGNEKVVEMLQGDLSQYLLLKEDYSHRYPYDWRTKQPILIRMTEQWFAELKDLKNVAKEYVDEKIEMIPSSGRNRLKSFVESRDEWCISRQRTWGVPIPVFYKENNPSEYLATSESIEHVISLVEKHGTDCWFEMSEDQLLSPQYRNQGWKKGTDTLDVWFDSGTTWFGVVKASGIPLPADVYLEGSDQHRGWFQSSLLTSLAYQGVPPYKKIVTHGFVTDEAGKKMSKSIGNTIEPESIISKQGVDVLRLWVSHSDFSVDVSIGKNVIEKVSTNLKKIRNTAKFMLGVLENYDPNLPVSKEQLVEVDYYIINRVKQFCDQITESYENFNYYKVNQLLMTFTYELSSFYLDIVKDRLYCGEEEARKPSQKVIHYILDCYTKALSPIICHTAEDIYQSMEFKKNKSIFEEGWFIKPEDFFQGIELPQEEKTTEMFNQVIELRQEIFKLIEKARMDKVFRTSNEVKVTIESVESEKLIQAIQPLLSQSTKQNKNTQLEDIMMVSSVEWLKGINPNPLYTLQYETSLDSKKVSLSISKADLHKCPRCWRFASVVENEPCGRCAHVLEHNHQYH